MSRQPSPGSAAAGQQTSYYRDAHGIPIEKPGPQIKIVYRGGEHQASQGASTPIPVATSSSTGRTKSRAYQSGIVAGAEDVKYAAKYRDLKQKVKEIEADNDRLVFKVLQAKRNIQRAKLERAILYERLGALPASPPQGNAPLPPQHAVPQQVPPGAPVPRHPEAQPYGQSSRHQRVPGPPAPHHHHRPHHQQPIQPAPPPPAHVSPPQHHAHHPPRDAAHPGQLPITHAQQVTTIQLPDGPLLVVAGPNGQPVMTKDGHYIPAQEIHHPPPPPSSGTHQRKRGGRVSKEVREMREREAREIREREEMERKQALLVDASGAQPPHSEPGPRTHSGHMSPPQAPAGGAPVSRERERERERERDWENERELRERERMQRREGREDDRDRERERHGHHSHHHHAHGHGHGHGHHHHHQQAPERAGAGSPPPPAVPGQSPVQTSPPQVHRSHSQASHTSHASYRSHHSHVHVHTHSHSSSPHSPGGSSYPSTRIHNHQRVGPGSYVLRDRTTDRDAGAPPSEAVAAQTPASETTTAQEESPANANAPPTSRVPTPPYMQRSSTARNEVFGNQAATSANGEDPPSGSGSISGAKSDAEGGSGGSNTPT